ncbi:MAG: MFS transporter [Kiritimatiellaeota bacterium]|nr:MFS transporter [Kiritimatiellota bacterium]
MTKRPLFYGWWMVASAFVFMMLIVGFALYGLPLFYPFWVEEMHWQPAQIQLGNTLSKILVAPLGFFVGWIVDRRGPRGVMALGAVFAALALLGFSQAHSLPWLYTFFFCNALGYLCAGPLPNQVLLAQWFSRLRGRVTGTAYVGIGVGGMLVPWVIFFLNRLVGWRGTLAIVGVLFAIIMFALLFFVRRRPADLGLFPDGDEQPANLAAARPPPVSLARILRTSAFWLLAAGTICSIGAIGGVMQNLPLYIKDILPKETAALMKTNVMSLTLFSSIAGRIAMGWLADRCSKKYVMLATYLIIGGALPLLWFAPARPELLYVFAVTFGFGLGADYMLIPLLAADCFGLGALSRVLGIIIMSNAIGEALLPYVVAHLRGTTGSYTAGFALLTALAFAGALAILCIRYRDGKPACRAQVEN